MLRISATTKDKNKNNSLTFHGTVRGESSNAEAYEVGIENVDQSHVKLLTIELPMEEGRMYIKNSIIYVIEFRATL